MTEVTPNLPHCGNFCKYCFMGTLLSDAPCQNPHTIAICTTGRSPSGSLCFLYSGRNCVKLTQFLLVRFKQGLGWAAFAKRSATIKAPVGLLSGNAVCDSRWRGVAPTSATPTRSLRKCRRIAEVKSRMDRKFSRCVKMVLRNYL